MPILKFLFFMLCAPPLWAVPYGPVIDNMTPGTVTIIGESHKRVESVEMFQDLALAAAGRHRCVVVGLEIASDQQQTLDAVMRGRASVSDVALWSPIDHPPYRRMLEDFAESKRQGLCIEVIAIDSGMDNKIDRDQWMAQRLTERTGEAPAWCCSGRCTPSKKPTGWWRPASPESPRS